MEQPKIILFADILKEEVTTGNSKDVPAFSEEDIQSGVEEIAEAPEMNIDDEFSKENQRQEKPNYRI